MGGAEEAGNCHRSQRDPGAVGAERHSPACSAPPPTHSGSFTCQSRCPQPAQSHWGGSKLSEPRPGGEKGGAGSSEAGPGVAWRGVGGAHIAPGPAPQPTHLNPLAPQGLVGGHAPQVHLLVLPAGQELVQGRVGGQAPELLCVPLAMREGGRKRLVPEEHWGPPFPSGAGPPRTHGPPPETRHLHQQREAGSQRSLQHRVAGGAHEERVGLPFRHSAHWPKALRHLREGQKGAGRSGVRPPSREGGREGGAPASQAPGAAPAVSRGKG